MNPPLPSVSVPRWLAASAPLLLALAPLAPAQESRVVDPPRFHEESPALLESLSLFAAATAAWANELEEVEERIAEATAAFLNDPRSNEHYAEVQLRIIDFLDVEYRRRFRFSSVAEELAVVYEQHAQNELTETVSAMEQHLAELRGAAKKASIDAQRAELLRELEKQTRSAIAEASADQESLLAEARELRASAAAAYEGIGTIVLVAQHLQSTTLQMIAHRERMGEVEEVRYELLALRALLQPITTPQLGPTPFRATQADWATQAEVRLPH